MESMQHAEGPEQGPGNTSLHDCLNLQKRTGMNLTDGGINFPSRTPNRRMILALSSFWDSVIDIEKMRRDRFGGEIKEFNFRFVQFELSIQHPTEMSSNNWIYKSRSQD